MVICGRDFLEKEYFRRQLNTVLCSVAMGVSSVGSSAKMLQILFVICSLQ